MDYMGYTKSSLSTENGSANRVMPELEVPSNFPASYRIFATLLHSVIFLVGMLGNLAVIYVSLRNKSLQTPPYRYLVSLALTDLLVLLSAVPEAIVFHNVGRRWMADQLACSTLVFINFLGINAGSLSILGFTIEIYVAVCRPMTAKKFCTLDGANKTVAGLWTFAFLYCLPWTFLTEVKSNPESPDHKICDFRLSKEEYVYYFLTDLALFYLTPLLVALVIYCKIIRILHHARPLLVKPTKPVEEKPSANGQELKPAVESTTLLSVTETAAQNLVQQELNTADRMHSRAIVVWMLIAVVLYFAVAWLPYRGWLVYNAFLDQPWLDIWFLLFAKTLIYLNSSTNPILYSAMSSRFRQAFKGALTCTVINPPDTVDISLMPTFQNQQLGKDGHPAATP